MTARLELVVDRHWCPKRGSTRAEYEDALASNKARGRFAVADGASESSFARLWARSLVHSYVRARLHSATLLDDLRPLQAQWRRHISAKPQPWYVAAKVQTGAFAAFVGLSISRAGHWNALAIGDCCLFHVRDDVVRFAFPLTHSSAFDARPILVSSVAERNYQLPNAMRTAEGVWNAGDTFLLMSDALAAYFLGQASACQKAASAILGFGDGRAAFENQVEALRADRVLRNDDVSLIVVQVC